MAIKITQKEQKLLSVLLKKSINGIDNIYKFEGFILGMICSENMIMPSVFLEKMFGSDSEGAVEWDSIDQLNEFMAIYSKINNKSATKLQSHIYRPLFVKTREQVSDSAEGFMSIYSSSYVDEYDAGLAIVIICMICKPNPDLLQSDEEYATLFKEVNKSPLKYLASAIRDLNAMRLETQYNSDQTDNSNIIPFNETFH